MKLADAYKMSNTVVGFVKCTYAMIYKLTVNTNSDIYVYQKLWSFNKRNIKGARYGYVEYFDSFCTPIGNVNRRGYIPVMLTPSAIELIKTKAKGDSRFANVDLYDSFYVKESAVDWMPGTIENVTIQGGVSLKDAITTAENKMQSAKNLLYVVGATNVLGVPMLSVPGTAAAFAHYRKTKEAYEQAEEQYAGIYAAVMAYNQRIKDYISEKEISQNQETFETEFPNGVHMSTILRVGNLAKVAGLVGDLFRVQASVVFTNTSDVNYILGNVAADCHVLETPVYIHKIKLDGDTVAYQYVHGFFELKSGETVEIKLPGGVTTLGEEKDDELRKIICDACGKRLITSCPKVNIEDIETADILFEWTVPGDKNANRNRKTCKASQRPGILRYCGEAFYPSDK